MQRRQGAATLSSGLALQQRQQRTACIERHQVVAAAHMGGANENLRYRAPPGDLHHVLALDSRGELMPLLGA